MPTPLEVTGYSDAQNLHRRHTWDAGVRSRSDWEKSDLGRGAVVKDKTFIRIQPQASVFCLGDYVVVLSLQTVRGSWSDFMDDGSVVRIFDDSCGGRRHRS